ncbi:transaldolase [Caulobacter segnis]|uniref:transaldolase n=1 Tax=Caulobacter segnis TaxID=88688 RepID=UPI0024106F0A|nr:transaldolase [Caulobacter segnis]MDG2521173.1 transaldolase [Caulobacter segnis]
MGHIQKEFRDANAAAAGVELKLYGDGASLDDFARLHAEGRVTGFTTNPTLMYKAGVTDYAGFAKQLLALIPDMPISFEVFSDEFEEMERQARLIAGWGENAYVKIPITNTKGESSLPLVEKLSREGVKLNVTAILTLTQAAGTVAALDPNVPGIISIFAGRIADTGIDPMPIMRAAVAMAAEKPKAEVLWASTREALNIYQARECGCHIITATPDILKKMDQMAGMDLDALSLDTVAMFRRDAVAAGFTL